MLLAFFFFSTISLFHFCLEMPFYLLQLHKLGCLWLYYSLQRQQAVDSDIWVSDIVLVQELPPSHVSCLNIRFLQHRSLKHKHLVEDSYISCNVKELWSRTVSVPFLVLTLRKQYHCQGGSTSLKNTSVGSGLPTYRRTCLQWRCVYQLDDPKQAGSMITPSSCAAPPPPLSLPLVKVRKSIAKDDETHT